MPGPPLGPSFLMTRTSPLSTCRAVTAAKQSSSHSKTRARPSNRSVSMPGVLTTAPFGAREPRSTASPPSGWNGSFAARTILPSGSNASATFWPSVRPFTVIASPSIRPADSSSRRITGTPPIWSSSLMT